MLDLYIKRAQENTPALNKKNLYPVDRVCLLEDESSAFGVKAVKASDSNDVLKKGDSVIFDFGEHCVGNVSFSLSYVDAYLDAPVKLRFRFGEIPYEIYRDFSEYKGGISGSWLQEEIVVVDFCGNVNLPRRYCFRYMEVTVLETPQLVKLSDFTVVHTTSADRNTFKEISIDDKELIDIDRISAKTLEDCMQSVYEDGPKRDRRLWSGDFRLQALADYYLFKNYDLIKRCLYLYAACHTEGQYLPSCIYYYPELYCKKKNGFMDYAFLYTVAVCEYYEHTKDVKTVLELFPIIKSQIEICIAGLDENYILTIPEDSNGFIDWVPGLSKLTSTHGCFLFALEKNIELAYSIGENELADKWKNILELSRKKSFDVLFNEGECKFINEYDNFQYSVHAQVWMILGGVIDGDKAKEILRKSLSDKESIKPVSPYMHHYVVEAMFKTDMKEEAKRYIKNYWGEMVKLGADTFWEIFVPSDLSVSPYGDAMINSFCHAWSCTPSYFIRKYLI